MAGERAGMPPGMGRGIMRSAACSVGAALALSWSVASAQTHPKVDPALETMVQKFTEAFNRFDAKAVAAFHAKDATLINPMGDVAHGPDGIARMFDEVAAKRWNGSTSRFTITGSRKLGPSTTWLDLDQEVQNVTMPDGTTGTMKVHVVWLAQKLGGTWKVLEARPYMFLPKDHGQRAAAGGGAAGGGAGAAPSEGAAGAGGAAGSSSGTPATGTSR
jgi:uncharacterized protein (TIGR02246 family)